MRRTREYIWIPVLVAVAGVIWFVLYARSESEVVVDRVAREDAALAVVKQLAEAQTRYHASAGRYGWIQDLRGSGGLDGITWRTEGMDVVAATPGYRIDVLLPATTSAGEAIAMGIRSEERTSERLARKHFAVVARPWGDDTSAWRTWYLDERGRIYVNEGVSDPLTRDRPPLPTVRVPEPGGVDAAGLRWWPLDDLPPR